MKMVKVSCAQCKKIFEKQDKTVTYFRKKNPNWNFFCESECYKAFRTKEKADKPIKKYVCESCGDDFEISSTGSGGKNRKYCFECFPEGLSKKERSDLRMHLLRVKANREKVELGCKICSYNKTAMALGMASP